jgi:hypothetical protein
MRGEGCGVMRIVLFVLLVFFHTWQVFFSVMLTAISLHSEIEAALYSILTSSFRKDFSDGSIKHAQVESGGSDNTRYVYGSVRQFYCERYLTTNAKGIQRRC